MFITTSLKGAILYEELARKVSSQLEIPYIKRNAFTISALCKRSPDGFLLFSDKGPTFYNGEGRSHYFHLSMAQLRILQLSRGKGDHLVGTCKEFLEVDKGDDGSNKKPLRLLDCTFGLGSDSIVLSYGLRENILIDGIEGFLPLAYIGNYGLRHSHHEDKDIMEAMKRIHLYHMDYSDFLKGAPSDSYDLVYFDPMFDKPVYESPQFSALRDYVNEEPLVEDIFEEAKRVAKKAIIVKNRIGSSLFDWLRIKEFVGGKYSRICYGLYRLDHE